ncbi:galanin receptor 2a-like [Hydractinia symbiolongicarpus]|uniref:galanin receptor 2a-like n=1 Tax=Hydractinia symbiolongicarpus TaxID=13093 RepID=UPI00254E9098|nr:galanin receptor 2a-like [Hydractinia symbiolongicarpus]
MGRVFKLFSVREYNLLLHWISSVPVSFVICILGLIGNVLCCIVWNRIGKKSETSKSCSIYLIVLAVGDSGVLLFFLLTTSLQVEFPSVRKTYAYAVLYSWVAYPLMIYFKVYSRWVMIAVTLNRFLVLRFPLQSATFNTRRKTVIVLTVLAVVLVPFVVPFWFYFAPEKRGDGYKLNKTDFGTGNGGVINQFWVHCVFLILVPFLSILVLNILIIRKLSTRAKKTYSISNKGLTRAKQMKTQLTKSLLAVTFLFIALLFWQCVSKCFYMLQYGKESRRVWKIVDGNFALSKIGLVLNSSINTLIYSVIGTRFRNEVRRLFCCSGGAYTQSPAKEQTLSITLSRI